FPVAAGEGGPDQRRKDIAAEIDGRHRGRDQDGRRGEARTEVGPGAAGPGGGSAARWLGHCQRAPAATPPKRRSRIEYSSRTRRKVRSSKSGQFSSTNTSSE